MAMSNWLNIPVKERIGLLREYKKLGYSYSGAKKDFESSLLKYKEGGTLSTQVPTQQPASSINVVGRNPMYEMQLMQRNQLKQDLFQEASKGNPEAEQQFREIFGTSTHRYRYDNDPQYREQTQTNMREHTGAKIDYPSTDLRREGNIAPNTAWMYPQLQGKGKQAMTEFSNQVIETALPIPGIDKINKAAKIVNTKGLKGAYYHHAPWTWKPDIDNFYRAGSKEMLDDVLSSGMVRTKQRETLMDRAVREGRKPTMFEKLDAGSRAGGVPYFSKGTPLSSKYHNMYGTGTGSNYGDYIIETASKEMKQIGPKGRMLKEEIIGEAILPGRSATPISTLLGDEVKLLEPHWLYGYKEYKPNFELGGVIPIEPLKRRRK